MLHIKSFTFNPFGENTYILFNHDQEAILIDPGNYDESETELLQNFIKENSLQITNILLTHAHIDHVLGMQWAFDEYKIPVTLHPQEQEILERNPMTARQYGFFLKPFNGELNFINEGETVSLGEEQMSVLHLPGHSPGSIGFYSAKHRFMISGDVLFEGSIGRTDLYKGSHEQLLESIRTKIFTLDGETKIYPGHGDPTTAGFEKQYNPFF